MSEPAPRPAIRIGDAERDRAVELLREHMTAGRLDHLEFEERLERALRAHTQPELDELFVDLPGQPPEQVMAVPEGSGASRAVGVPAYVEPWWCHWSMFAVAILLAGVSRGELGVLVPLMAVWVWLIGPRIARERHARAVARGELGATQPIGQLGTGMPGAPDRHELRRQMRDQRRAARDQMRRRGGR